MFKRPHIYVLSAGLLLLLGVVLVALAAPDGVRARDKGFRFKNPVVALNVSEGHPRKRLVRVRAVGIDRSRIRYAISGDPAFKINERSARISYDGRRISSNPVDLTITARDTQGEHDNISHTLRVVDWSWNPIRRSSTVPTPTPTPRPVVSKPDFPDIPIPKNAVPCTVGLNLHEGQACYVPNRGDGVVIYNKQGCYFPHATLGRLCMGNLPPGVTFNGLGYHGGVGGLSLSYQVWTINRVP